MPKAIQLPKDAITSMFDALDILGKIDRRELHTEEVKHTPATNQKYAGGVSCYGIHRRQSDDTHVATTHVIRMPDGSEPHRHGKDILLGSIKFAEEAE